MKNAGYFYAAYGLVWLAVVLYAGWLASRISALEERLARRDDRRP